MSMGGVLSHWTSRSQPAPEPFVSEQPPYDPERRSRLLLRRLYDLLPDDAQARLRTGDKVPRPQVAAA